MKKPTKNEATRNKKKKTKTKLGAIESQAVGEAMGKKKAIK